LPNWRAPTSEVCRAPISVLEMGVQAVNSSAVRAPKGQVTSQSTAMGVTQKKKDESSAQEIRRPRGERNPKAEIRGPKEVRRPKHGIRRKQFGSQSAIRDSHLSFAQDLAKRLDCGDSSPLCRTSGRTCTSLRNSDLGLRPWALGLGPSHCRTSGRTRAPFRIPECGPHSTSPHAPRPSHRPPLRGLTEVFCNHLLQTGHPSGVLLPSAFGARNSAFFRPSDLGLRTWAFALSDVRMHPLAPSDFGLRTPAFDVRLLPQATIARAPGPASGGTVNMCPTRIGTRPAPFLLRRAPFGAQLGAVQISN
jgi:hypothetical protein